jgi:hypothetical protein
MRPEKRDTRHRVILRSAAAVILRSAAAVILRSAATKDLSARREIVC